MLSAAAAALLTAAVGTGMSARADTEVSTATSTALATSTAGNITIDSTGSVGISTASAPAVTINSSNFLINNGSISNTNADSAIGVLIDTTSGNQFPPAGAFASTGSIDLGGSGTNKRGIVIQGGHTYYGPITLTNLTAVAVTGATATAQSSAVIVQGDGSAAFLLTQGTSVTSNVLFGGGGIIQNSTVNSTQSNAIMVDFDGTVNGDVFLASSFSGVGAGMIGFQTLGGIHSCASDTSAPAGFSCPVSSGGSLVNTGQISLIGTSTPSTRGGNAEAGTALVIGGSIDGGFINFGPGTSNNTAAASIRSAGLIVSGVTQPTVLIDPTRSITNNLTAPRGPVILGPVTADIDAIDPGYALINRGTIAAQALDSDLSTAAMMIQGASQTYFTCLSAMAGSCSTTPQTVTQSITSTVNGVITTTNQTVNNVGGLLNTGNITAIATTNSQTITAAGTTSATALYIGPFATVPRLDVKSEAVSGSSNTSGSISAAVAGIGQGSAFGVILGINSNVPVINVSKNASIIAQAQTSTVSPTKSIASSTSPFSLVSEAILDQGGSLKTINNAGTIQAVNTTLTPDTGAVVSSITNAIDLSASTTGGATINNSGRILGNIFLGSGNGNTVNVGNIGAGGTTANSNTGVQNTA